MNIRPGKYGVALIVGACLTWTAAAFSQNLIVNGSFDDPDDPLKGWKFKYDLPGESLYFENHTFIKVLESHAGRKGVLTLSGTFAMMADFPGQGSKVDSDPIPFDPTKRYRFSAWARSEGPDCRILIEGYKWKPGIKPHEKPALHELRKVYRFSQLYFGAKKEGELGGVPRGADWRKGEDVFPSAQLTPMAQKFLKEVRFLVVHIVAIGRDAGTLYVDDVRLETIN